MNQAKEHSREQTNNNNGLTLRAILIGAVLIALILLAGSFWVWQSTKRANDEAVRSVSRLYLDELAGRRARVVAGALRDNVQSIQNALATIESGDLESEAGLQAFQRKMKRLNDLEKFAFVDAQGRIHTSSGIETNIGEYSFPYRTPDKADISVLSTADGKKKIIVAVPAGDLPYGDTVLRVCFTQTSMEKLMEAVSLDTADDGITFCNLYTSEGAALTDLVLGGLAGEDNLFDAMRHAVFERGYTLEDMIRRFSSGEGGVVSFTYNGIRETLSFVPVSGTDWQLTYLIRESVISDRIGSISRGILIRSVLQTLAAALVLVLIFAVMISQNRKAARLLLEKETTAAESRIRQQELEQRLSLQEQLLEQEKQRVQQDRMITALASDYRSVYYVDLDADRGICYRSDTRVSSAMPEGTEFPYLETFTAYADKYVAEKYRKAFLSFIDPASILKELEKEPLLSFRYLVRREDTESYEMLRIAAVSQDMPASAPGSRAVGIGFTDVDRETRETLAQNQALSDALAAAQEASKAKTVFLSNMSHEIRTPMNAIIGLDNIALNDPDISPATREYLTKIGSSAEHLLHLINDILDMSRIESGRMTLRNEEFSFLKLIGQVNTIFSGQCTEKGLDYHCDVSSEIADHYIGDNMKLRQVLINILSNAVKFTPEGGRVELSVDRTAHYDRKSTLQFKIRDTGIGMSREFLPHIFDTFSQEDASSTNRYGSSGLGLSITRNLVEMMNGRIEVESDKGKGSVFTVTLTLLDTDAGAASDAEESAAFDPGTLKVLVVDDDPIACEHARLVLEKTGISCETCLTGADALDLVRMRHARRDPYHLILMDWKMPEMDGLETTRQIRAIIGDESPIIILTAYKWDEIMEEAVNAGVDSFISKPLFASSVLEEYGSSLRKKNTASGRTQRAELAGRHILVAEDNEINAEIILMLLQMQEIRADLAENGKKAVELFEASAEGWYDAILMDMRMPEMDGLEASTRIHALSRSDAGTVPIIALTANAFDEDVQRSLQAGLNAHLSKPVEPDILFETLGSLIWKKEHNNS